MKKRFFSDSWQLKKLLFPFIFSLFTISSSSILTYIFLNIKKDQYPFNLKLSEFSTRLKYAFIEARNTKNNIALVNKEFFNRETFIESLAQS